MRTKKGIVTSAKTPKTATVTVTRFVMHPKYRKRYPVSKKFLADTNEKEVREGDEVLIAETRPMSKRKRFKILEVTKAVVAPEIELKDESAETVPTEEK